MKTRLLSKQDGMTLIELLIAFAILTIIFASFLTLFPQSAKYNERTEDMLSSIHLAREQLVVVQHRFGKQLLNSVHANPNWNKKSEYDHIDGLSLIEDIIERDDFYEIQTEDKHFKTTIKIFKVADFTSEVHDLHKVQVTINNEFDTEITEIFGYVTRNHE